MYEERELIDRLPVVAGAFLRLELHPSNATLLAPSNCDYRHKRGCLRWRWTFPRVFINRFLKFRFRKKVSHSLHMRGKGFGLHPVPCLGRLAREVASAALAIGLGREISINTDQDASQLSREMRTTALTVRKKAEASTVPLSSFLEEQRALFTAALDDRYSGMPPGEHRDFREKERKARRQDKFRDEWRDQNSLDRELRERKHQVQQTLYQLNENPVNVDALKRLFPDYAFQESTYPTNDDFKNLPQHHSYCRIGKASNVIPLASRMPKRTDRKRRDQVLEHSPRGTVLEFPSLTHEPTQNDFTDSYDEDD